MTRFGGDLLDLFERAVAGVVDEHGNLHAPKGLGKLSGRFVAKGGGGNLGDMVPRDTGAVSPNVASAIDAIRAAQERGERVFWRVHWSATPPFAPENAYSAPWDTNWHPTEKLVMEYGRYGDWVAPDRGYSVAPSAKSLVDYIEFNAGGEVAEVHDILVFTGEQVGTGLDGEPLVIPDVDGVLGRLKWGEFTAAREADLWPDTAPADGDYDPIGVLSAVAGHRYDPETGNSYPEMRNVLRYSADSRAGSLKRLYEGTFAGLTTRVDRIGDVRDGGAFVEGSVHNAAGDRVGQFGHALHADSDGRVWADLADVHLEAERGKGFATAFTRHVLDRYRLHGVAGVRVDAEEDGGYVWASFQTADGRGFEFADAGTAEHVLDKLRDEVAFRRSPGQQQFAPVTAAMREQLAAADELLARADRVGWGGPGFPTPREVSQIGRRDADTWLGRDVMDGTEWQGILRFGDKGT